MSEVKCYILTWNFNCNKMLTVIVLVLLVFIAAIIAYKLEQRKYDVRGIPGPVSLPFFGNAFIFGRNFVDYFNNVNKLHCEYGPIVRIWPIWITPVVLINDADAIQEILNSTVRIDKSREYKFLLPWLGTGLLISSGSKWHKRRKLLTPAFHFNILKEYVEIFHTETNVLIKKLSGFSGKGPFNVYPIVKLCALDIICKTAMGTSIKAQSTDVEYVKAVQEYLELILRRLFSAWKNFDTLYKYSLDAMKMKRTLKILHNFTNTIIANRRITIKSQNCQHGDEKVVAYKNKISFLDILLKASSHEELSQEDIREEVDTFTFEGHDTISSGLSFILYEIAKNPDIQNKIVEEINMIKCESQVEEFAYQHLQKLNYLGMVIKEGLRLYPPVAIFLREMKEDVQLGNYSVPKKCTVAVNAFSLHRQEKYFANPDQFIPERFNKDKLMGQHPFSYIPFSAGPRNCIGQKYAMLEMKSIISTILMNFKLLPDPKHKLSLYFDSILKSDTGIYLQLEKRE